MSDYFFSLFTTFYYCKMNKNMCKEYIFIKLFNIHLYRYYSICLQCIFIAAVYQI